MDARFFCLVWFFLAVVGFELRASHLLGRCSTTGATPPVFTTSSSVLCCSNCFLGGVSCGAEKVCFSLSMNQRVQISLIQQDLRVDLEQARSSMEARQYQVSPSWREGSTVAATSLDSFQCPGGDPCSVSSSIDPQPQDAEA
jgi:hypothetical protein